MSHVLPKNLRTNVAKSTSLLENVLFYFKPYTLNELRSPKTYADLT